VLGRYRIRTGRRGPAEPEPTGEVTSAADVVLGPA
jgi:hypothetical protein